MSTTLLSGVRSAVPVDRSPLAKVATRTSWLQLLVVPMAFGLTQAPWWWEAVTRWGPRSPLGVVALVPVLALLAGWWNLRRDPRGRQIHDRQLDLILCALFTIGAIGLLLLAGGGRSLEAAGASCLTAGAIVVAGWGSRALWQVRWPVLLLLLTWVEPWEQLNRLLSPLAARLAVELGQLVTPVIASATTPTGGWRLVSADSGLALDPTAGGGVVLVIFIGLASGIAWASAGSWSPLGAIGLGAVGGVAVATTEWLACVFWASSGSSAAVYAWASGSVHLWSLLLVVVLTAIAVAARPSIEAPRRSTVSSPEPSAVRAIGRLRAAVPAADRAAYAVAAVCAVLAVLTARATAPVVYATVSGTITQVVEALWV